MDSHQPPLVARKLGELPFPSSSGYHNKLWILGLNLLAFVPPTFGPSSLLSSGLAVTLPHSSQRAWGREWGLENEGEASRRTLVLS